MTPYGWVNVYMDTTTDERSLEKWNGLESYGFQSYPHAQLRPETAAERAEAAAIRKRALAEAYHIIEL